jgi:hypothetical protein
MSQLLGWCYYAPLLHFVADPAHVRNHKKLRDMHVTIHHHFHKHITGQAPSFRTDSYIIRRCSHDMVHQLISWIVINIFISYILRTHETGKSLLCVGFWSSSAPCQCCLEELRRSHEAVPCHPSHPLNTLPHWPDLWDHWAWAHHQGTAKHIWIWSKAHTFFGMLRETLA